MDNKTENYLYPQLSSLAISGRRLKLKIDEIINSAALLLGAAGVILLIWFLYQEISILNTLSFKSFINGLLTDWRGKYFFYSILFDLFLIYRLSLKNSRRQKIKGHPKNVDIFRVLSDGSQVVLEDAYLLAFKLKQTEVNAVHLFVALLADPTVRHLCLRLNVNPLSVSKMLARQIKNQGATVPPVLSGELQAILAAAYIAARDNQRRAVDTLDVLFQISNTSEIIAEVLNEHEIDAGKIKNAVAWFRINELLIKEYKEYHRLSGFRPKGAMNRAYTAVATPTLNYYSTDLTLLAKYGRLSFCVGRDPEIKSVFDAFSSAHYGVLLVGQSGVGKRSIVEGIARLMVKEQVPDFLKDKRLVEIDTTRLISGTTPSEAEARLLTLIDEAARAGNVILFFDNLENITGLSSGADGSLELSEVLAKAISQGQIYCLACAHQDSYAKFIEPKTLGEVMTTVGVSEAGRDLTIQVLESKVGFWEGKHNVYIDYPALEQAVDLSSRYINDKFLPEKAITVLEAAALKAAQSRGRKNNLVFCNRETVAETISSLTGIPVQKVSESETKKLLNLEAQIHERLIGQDEAVKAIAGSLRRARAELREGRRPIASFLFLGPTGVGKTELAKTVAAVYFGDEKAMIRLDMSEYQMADSVVKMIGDNNGALGYLTEAVRKKPFALILLDEIEKAHPDILNLFLQLMDDGRLTDGQGKTINFTNTIVVATSNAGALYISEAIGRQESLPVIKQELIDNQLNKVMRPELINRFDGLVVFSPLTFEEVVAITKLMLDKIKKNLESKGIGLLASEAGIRALAKSGHDPKFGARPLRRLLQEKIENEIANILLNKSLKRRDLVVIDETGNLKIEKAKAL
ncbi:MAG TPA: ATP-dependent Clp protease ATP-binding subunit [bacterium]|nr:ATP-dependent Clp protease ATP-binding subunit [bacterium]HPT30151.1 ATP-dependent Clp protease ATP-binding subunit [bacterium]